MFAERSPFQETGFVQGMKLPTVAEIQAAIASLNAFSPEAKEFKDGLVEALSARKAAFI